MPPKATHHKAQHDRSQGSLTPSLIKTGEARPVCLSVDELKTAWLWAAEQGPLQVSFLRVERLACWQQQVSLRKGSVVL